MKERAVLVRLDDSDYKALREFVEKNNGMKNAEAMRLFMREGLAGYDRKHEETLRHLAAIEASLAQLIEISAASATLTATLDVPRFPADQLKEITGNLKRGFEYSDAVIIGQAKGLFKKKG